MGQSISRILTISYLLVGPALILAWLVGNWSFLATAVGLVAWIVLAVVGAVVASQLTPNIFSKMTDDELLRARRCVAEIEAKRPLPPEDAAWLEALYRRYGKNHTAKQLYPSLRLAVKERRTTAKSPPSAPVSALPEASSLSRGPASGQPSLHDGSAIVLARAARRPGFDVTRDGESWFGGLPALGDAVWPLDQDGQPMTPLAQIALTGLAEAVKVPGLPQDGSLAFFAALPERGDWIGRVVRVANPGLPIQPPGPLPQVMNHSFGGPIRRGEPGDDQLLYPRMAMQLVPISASGRTDPKAFKAEVEAALGPGRQYNLSASLFEEAMPDPKRPWNRDSLLRFLRGARIALGSGAAAEKELRKAQASYPNRIKSLTEKLAGETTEREVLQARLDNTKAALKRLDSILADYPGATRQLVEELETMDAWAQGGNRWAPLTEAEQAMLAPLLAPWTASQGLGSAHLERTHQIHRYLKDGVDETLLVMAVAGDDLFTTLPDAVREAINGPWRQPYDRGNHQMFGCPDSVQVAAEDNEDARLLLQLQCDDIAGFYWGDAGVLQFWIRPKDLEAGRWDRAYMTFEGN